MTRSCWRSFCPGGERSLAASRRNWWSKGWRSALVAISSAVVLIRETIFCHFYVLHRQNKQFEQLCLFHTLSCLQLYYESPLPCQSPQFVLFSYHFWVTAEQKEHQSTAFDSICKLSITSITWNLFCKNAHVQQYLPYTHMRSLQKFLPVGNMKVSLPLPLCIWSCIFSQLSLHCNGKVFCILGTLFHFVNHHVYEVKIQLLHSFRGI